MSPPAPPPHFLSLFHSKHTSRSGLPPGGTTGEKFQDYIHLPRFFCFDSYIDFNPRSFTTEALNAFLMKWSYLPLSNLQSLSKPQAAALFCLPSHPQTLLGMASRTPESTRVDKLLKLLLPGSPGFLVDYGHHRVPYQLLNSMQSFLETFCFICSRGIHGPSCKAGAQECPGGAADRAQPSF